MGIVRYLLDTCTFVWLCAKPDQLSPAAVSAMKSKDSDLVISHVSILEITLKWTAGKIVLPFPPRTWVQAQMDIWQLDALSIEVDDIYRCGELPNVHRDPFDRLLVCTALSRNLVIVTPDEWIRRYPVSTLW